MNIQEVKKYLTDIIIRNKALSQRRREKGDRDPVAVLLRGPHGIGKTQIVEQLAKEFGYHLITVNGGELAEPSDITGYPGKWVWITNGETRIEIDSVALPLYKGWEVDSNFYQKTSLPNWITSLKENSILYIDDYTRTTPQTHQALMDVILYQRITSQNYIFPNNVTVILSSNPSNSDYNVIDTDPAQATRYLSFDVEASEDVWGEYAIKSNYPDLMVDFVRQNNIFDPKLNISPREITLFTQLIEDKINNLDDKAVRKDVSVLAQACTGSEHLGQAFVTFVTKNMHKLFTIKQILETESLESVLNHIQGFDASVKALFVFRIATFGKTNGFTEKETDRLIEIFTESHANISSNKYFSLDQLSFIIQKCHTNKTFSDKLFLKNPTLALNVIVV